MILNYQYFFRHSLAFIRKGKEKCEESRKSSALLDESLKDEIRLLHGSVFDLYLDSLNIREAKYQDIAASVDEVDKKIQDCID